MSGMATLHELRTVYSLADLSDFHEALDVEQDARRRAKASDPTLDQIKRLRTKRGR